MTNENHNINFDGAETVIKCKNFIKRKIMESILVDKVPNFNNSKGAYNFNPILTTILHKSFKHRLK